MKFLTLASVLALSTAAFAAPNTSINDLQYLPDAGTKYGFTQVNYVNDEEGSARTSGFTYSQTFGYSLQNNLSLEVGLDYVDQESRGGRAENGFTNPTIHGKYRLIDQNNTRLDVFAGAHINAWGDTEVTNNRESANEGGHSFDIGAIYGHKHENFQWSVGATILRKLEETTKDKVNGGKEKHKAHNQIDLEANLLTAIYKNSFIKTSLGFNMDEPHEIKGGGTHNAVNTYRIGAEYQHVCKNDLYLAAGLTQNTQNVNDVKSTHFVYHVGAGYQF